MQVIYSGHSPVSKGLSPIRQEVWIPVLTMLRIPALLYEEAASHCLKPRQVPRYFVCMAGGRDWWIDIDTQWLKPYFRKRGCRTKEAIWYPWPPVWHSFISCLPVDSLSDTIDAASTPARNRPGTHQYPPPRYFSHVKLRSHILDNFRNFILKNSHSTSAWMNARRCLRGRAWNLVGRRGSCEFWG